MSSPERHAPDAAEPKDNEPDYRFTLANERTMLAYLRTALALDAAGLAAVQFLTDFHPRWVRLLAGALLAVAGTVCSAGGYLRWRAVQRSMRLSQPLPETQLAMFVAAVVALTSLVAAIGILSR